MRHRSLSPFVLTVVVGVLTLVPAGVHAQSPSPLPAIALRAADSATDDTFRLDIRVDATRTEMDGPPIQVDTSLAYVGDEEHIAVTHAYGGIVAFGVRQLDGPFRPGGPGRRMSLQEETWHLNEYREIPFAKSGGFSADDPQAEAYRTWFADPMIHLGPGTYEVLAQAEYGVPGEAASRVLEASVIVRVVPGSAERPFTAPLVPRPLENPDLPAWAPEGPPSATVTQRGVRYELWVSTDTLAPGEWAQVAVRATNVGDTPVWQIAGECGRYASAVVASAVGRDTGARQTGNAAAFKQRALRVGGASPRLRAQELTAPSAWSAMGRVSVESLAECSGTMTPPLVKLPPGASRWERFAAYAGARVDARFAEPLTPGRISLSAEWPYAGRGDRPRVTWQGLWPDPIRVSTPLTLTGGGPTSPSLGTLVDAALADPRFRAWVDAHPDGEGWTVDVGRWPGPIYDNPRWATVGDRAPDGMTELSLGHSSHWAHALLDTWTGELLDVVFE